MSRFKIAFDGTDVTLPSSVASENDTVFFSSWKKAEKDLRTFVRRFYANGRCTQKRVAVGLVHRADNDYNANAIAVVIASDEPGTIDDRHLGYLFDHYLRKVGAKNLPELINFAGGEVRCDAIIHDRDALGLDLPEPDVLGEAIKDFLAGHGIEAQDPPPRWEPKPRPQPVSQTKATLKQLRTFSVPAFPIESVQVTLSGRTYDNRRTLRLTANNDLDEIGYVDHGALFLNDERHRDAVLTHLKGLGISVKTPHSGKRPTIGFDSWPATEPLNAHLSDSETWWLTAGARGEENEIGHFAAYNPRSRVLWVEDQRLVGAAVEVMSRHGVNVDKVGLPNAAWALDEEVPYLDFGIRELKYFDPFALPALLAHQRSTVPRGTLTKVVTWKGVENPDAVTAAGRDPQFRTYHQFSRGRQRLFPEHALLGNSAGCRLCGEPGLVFTTPISTEALTYCEDCLNRGLTGPLHSRTADEVAKAVRAIIETEFDGELILPENLTPLHVNPAEPVDAAFIDRALLLRFAVQRAVPWTYVLEATGFAGAGIRTGRGTLIRARDGHLCHSLREKAVCDFLHLHGVAHDREPTYQHDPDYNPTGLRRADWELSDGTFVELWGMPKNPEYAAKMEAKRNLAQRHGLRLVELFDGDLANLPRIFAEWVPARTQAGWTWSPALVTAPAAATPGKPRVEKASARKKKAPAGDDRGRNAFNKAQRDERLERCRAAVSLQAEGHSRADIGMLMEIGPESVKALLRDGKFYADPTTDPDRQGNAKIAHDARQERVTKADFQKTNQLSTPKASEAWRDAGVIFESEAQ